MLTADMANRHHWSKNLVALLSEICLEMIFLIIFALIPLGSVTFELCGHIDTKIMYVAKNINIYKMIKYMNDILGLRF